MVAILAVLVLLPLIVSGQNGAAEARLRRASGQHSLDVLRWEVRHLLARADRLVAALTDDVGGLGEADRQRLRASLGTDEAGRSGLGPEAEAALERGLAAALRRAQVVPPLEFLPRWLLFPPVSVAIGELPRLVVVSPRHQIRVARTVLIEPGLDAAQAERLERLVDDPHSVSLVESVGGLSTYPAMLPARVEGRSLVELAAHEWAHAYLFFTPLGQRYWSDSQARTINETVADMVGRELARDLFEALGLPPPAQGSRRPRGSQGFDFNREMRVTRLEVERLLAAGQIEPAEAYMRQRREVFAQHGFPIRKLNQAYFAFHGAYAEAGAAGASPIAGQLRRLRQASESLGAFLWRAGQLRGADELARAAGE